MAELIHEALIRDWGALREWVDQEHRFQKWLGRTRERRARWATEKDPGDLLGGTALAEGLEWSGQRRLPADIESFLTVSRQRQRAVIRRSRRLNAVLGGLLVLALIAAGGLFGIVRVAALALTQDGHAGQAYIHNGPQALTTREQAEILADVPGRRESPGGRGVQHSMAVGFDAGNCVVDLVMLRQHPGHGTAC
ncbi:hypothetical protein [Streptomyces sp. NPDC052015]|uniref:hypothetical protein n=1 Tax=Streptomyces sp. NPDC052015 TaxID=3154755 RepID=UPI003438895C